MLRSRDRAAAWAARRRSRTPSPAPPPASRRLESPRRYGSSSYADDVRTSDAGVRPRLDVTIDARRALLLGVTSDDAAQTARLLSAGTLATRVRAPSGLLDVVVRGDALERGEIDLFQRFPVRGAPGTSVPLGALDRISRTTEPAIVEREDGGRIVTVTANPRGAEPIGPAAATISRAAARPELLARRNAHRAARRHRAVSRRGPQARRGAAALDRRNLRDPGRALSQLPSAARHHDHGPFCVRRRVRRAFCVQRAARTLPRRRHDDRSAGLRRRVRRAVRAQRAARLFPPRAVREPDAEPVLDAGGDHADRARRQERDPAGRVRRARGAPRRSSGRGDRGRCRTPLPADRDDDAGDDRRLPSARTRAYRRGRGAQGARHGHRRRSEQLAAADALRRPDRLRVAARKKTPAAIARSGVSRWPNPRCRSSGCVSARRRARCAACASSVAPA